MGGRKDFGHCLGSNLYGTSFEATRWFSLDPCGLAGVFCSFGVHMFALWTIVSHLIAANLFSTAIFLLVYVPIAMLALWSLYMAFSTNPGAVPMGARPLVTVKRADSNSNANGGRQRALRRCHKCNDNFKPNRAHHDSVTGRCIVKFDHFCPWVGNAVGALNHKFFVLFVGYTMCTCIVSLFLILIRAFHCGFVTEDPSEDAIDTKGGTPMDTTPTEDGSHELGEEDSNHRFLEIHYREECFGFYNSYATLVLLVVSVCFLVFTCCMLLEQVETIQTNSSKIARMKMKVGQAGTELARVTEEFNEMFGGTTNQVSWHWFLPTQVEFPRGMRKVVLGYEWDETFDAVPYEEPTSGSSVPLQVGGGNDEELGAVELTPTRSSIEKETSDNSAAAEEGSFVNSVEKHPRLTQRSNSRGPENRLQAENGSMT
eukprot:Nitzschia sp. Nitz4//scaffold8_size234185//12266//13635//NITZ4_001230-RA/size234185-augustus-gene-0.254-mRNA-1//-1//CDS//3329559725//8354//frame0